MMQHFFLQFTKKEMQSCMACSVWMCMNSYEPCHTTWYHVQNFCWLQSKTHSETLLSEVVWVVFRKSESPPSCTSCVEAEAVHPDALRGNSSRWCGRWLAWTPPWTRPRHAAWKKHGHKRLKQPVSSGFTSSEIWWWGKSPNKKHHWNLWMWMTSW